MPRTRRKTNLIRHHTGDHPPEEVFKNETVSGMAIVTRNRVVKKKLDQQKDFILPESDPDDRSNPVNDDQFCKKSELNELVDEVKSEPPPEPSYINLEDKNFTIFEENEEKTEALNEEFTIKREPSPEPSFINLEDEKFTIEENDVKSEVLNAELDNTDSQPVGIANKPEMVGTDDPHPVVVDRNQPDKVECDIKGKKKRSQKTVYCCQICDKHFKYHSLYKRHQIIHSDKTHFSCDICSKAFKQKCHLLSHMKCHSDSTPFACDICNAKKFRRNHDLAAHMKTHSEDRPFTCDICSIKFKWKLVLARHMKTHSDDRQFACHICSYKCKWKSNLASHKKTHSDDRPFTCDICNVKKFRRKPDLAAHMKTHSDDRPFTCDICSIKFKRKQYLARHMKTHGDDRPFTCDICNVKFKRKHDLATHMKSHTKEKKKERVLRVCMLGNK